MPATSWASTSSITSSSPSSGTSRSSKPAGCSRERAGRDKMGRLTILYFDCFSGAAGDMILGALIDAGMPIAELRRALGSLAIDPGAIWTERVTRAGLAATKFHVRGEDLPI